jgi:protein-S-isoprenylcysteine O-methyltransferase Ste14
MFEPFLIAAFPLLFMAVLAGGRASLRRRNIDMDGRPPIDRKLFLLSKLTMLIPWTGMVLQGFGVALSPARVPPPLKWVSLGLWIFGWGLLLAGRIGLGSSFRVGCPEEETKLRTGGAYRFSRNPMYLGLDATLLAAALFTLNPIVLLIGGGIAAVHHRIILAEEECLRKMFGQDFEEYCRRVGRYL